MPKVEVKLSQISTRIQVRVDDGEWSGLAHEHVIATEDPEKWIMVLGYRYYHGSIPDHLLGIPLEVRKI